MRDISMAKIAFRIVVSISSQKLTRFYNLKKIQNVIYEISWSIAYKNSNIPIVAMMHKSSP